MKYGNKEKDVSKAPSTSKIKVWLARWSESKRTTLLIFKLCRCMVFVESSTFSKENAKEKQEKENAKEKQVLGFDERGRRHNWCRT